MAGVWWGHLADDVGAVSQGRGGGHGPAGAAVHGDVLVAGAGQVVAAIHVAPAGRRVRGACCLTCGVRRGSVHPRSAHVPPQRLAARTWPARPQAGQERDSLGWVRTSPRPPAGRPRAAVRGGAGWNCGGAAWEECGMRSQVRSARHSRLAARPQPKPQHSTVQRCRLRGGRGRQLAVQQRRLTLLHPQPVRARMRGSSR